MSTETMPRNATRVRLDLPELDYATVQKALERGIRHAIGDPEAVVSWYPTGEEAEDNVVVVKQAHGTWWTMMPAGFGEAIGGYQGTSMLRWHDSKPPAAVDD